MPTINDGSPGTGKDGRGFEILLFTFVFCGFPGDTVVKNPPANAGHARDAGSIPGLENPLEEGMATHSSILAWRIPWTEEPGGLESRGSQRVRHN